MERWFGRTALVTGASSGIGRATASKLVKHGMKVVACARRLDRLQELGKELAAENGTLIPMQCDLSNEADILSMFATIKRDHGGVDVCINNAGLGHDAALLSGSTQQWKEMLDINVLAVCICTREAVKSMVERNVDDGYILHVNSMSGHRIIPSKTHHFYSASKFALRAILEGHRNELREMKSHIRVSEVSSGMVETEFVPQHLGESKAKDVFEGMKCLQAEDMADALIYMLAAPPHVQVHDILMRPTEQLT